MFSVPRISLASLITYPFAIPDPFDADNEIEAPCRVNFISMSASFPNINENSAAISRQDEASTSVVHSGAVDLGAEHAIEDGQRQNEHLDTKESVIEPLKNAKSSVQQSTAGGFDSNNNINSEYSMDKNESYNSAEDTVRDNSSSSTINNTTPQKGSCSLQTRVSPMVNGKTDIYGRTPPKEPQYPISCPTCGRIVFVRRFAAHLEKCLGISRRSSNGSTSKRS